MNKKKLMFAPHALLSRVALVRSPEACAPPQIALPVDIHPLPESIDAYFAYTFSAEDFTLSSISSKQVRRLLEQKTEYIAALCERRERDGHGDLASVTPKAVNGSSTTAEPNRLYQGTTAEDDKGKDTLNSPTGDQIARLSSDMDELNTL